MVKWVIGAILLLPVAEIAVFVVVAVAIGFGRALLLLLLTTLIGVLVLRQAGRGQLSGLRVAVGERNITAVEADGGGLLTVLGGLLLVLPGFITDLIGLVLLLGPVRRWCGALLRRTAHRHQQQRNHVVDLAPDEWRQVRDRELDNRRPPRAND